MQKIYVYREEGLLTPDTPDKVPETRADTGIHVSGVDQPNP